MSPNSFDFFSRLHNMSFGSVGGRLKTIAWRLYKYPNPDEWSIFRHEKDALYLVGFSDLADILATTQ